MRKNTTTRRLVLNALFIALTLLLGMTPLGLIPLGFVNVTILGVPVLVGTLLLGIKSGLLLGFCFGTVSTLSMMGLSMTAPSGLASALLAKSMPLAIIMCYVPRLLMPLCAYGVFKIASRGKENNVKALPFGTVAGSLTNTIFYLGLMYIFYSVTGLDAAAIKALITGTGLIAGSCEAVAAALIVTPVVTALWKISRKQEKEKIIA